MQYLSSPELATLRKSQKSTGYCGFAGHAVEWKPLAGANVRASVSEFISQECFSTVIVLRSYDTEVLAIDDDHRIYRLWSGYSATTMKHINLLLNECGLKAIGKAEWMALPVEEVAA